MAKKKKKVGLDPNAWMLTFSDLLTLLLTFFVLLLSMSSLNDMKIKEAFGALQGAVGAFEKGVQSELGQPPIIIRQSLPGKAGQSFMEVSNDIKKALDLATPKDFANTVKVEETEITIRADERGAIVAIPQMVLFSPGEAEMKEEGKRLMAVLGPVLRSFNNLLSVDGHTDDRPVTSALYPTGWELSMARALTVLHYLVGQENIMPQRLTAMGYDATRPVASNDTAEGRARNRRVDIILVRERVFWR